MWKNSELVDMKRFCAFVVLGVMYSCVADIGEDVSHNGDGCEFTVEVVRPDKIGTAVKSSFSYDDLQRMTDLNVFIYHQGKLLSDYSRYFPDMSALMLSFPYGLDGFNIYLIGNVGKLNAPEDEADMSSMRCVLNSYNEFRRVGFPVAEVCRDYRKGDPAHFKLKRLVGQYNVRMRVSASGTEYKIRDVRLYNCARDVYPFGDDIKASVFDCMECEGKCTCGDALTQEDVDALNSGSSVPLYFVENLQGVLLPDNTDRKLKIPSNLELIESGVADRCTYMEISADVVTPTARYHDAKYRFYLGQDQTTDFSIRRNTLHEVTLDFTQNMVCEEEWRIEVGDPEIVGIRIDKEEAMVIKGAEDMIYVQATGNDGKLLDFNAEIMSTEGLINVEKVQTYYRGVPELGRCQAFRITSNVKLCGLYPYGKEPEYLTEQVRISSKETYNGSPLFQKHIKVRIYDKLFPLLLRVEKNYIGRYMMLLKGGNPMGLGLSVSVSYTYDGGTVKSPDYPLYCQILDSGYINTSGAMFDETVLDLMASGLTPQNLSRIDFEVKGLRNLGGTTLAYPRLLAEERIYTGPDTEAFFGPGSDMYPGKSPDMANDAPYYIRKYYDDRLYWQVLYDTNDEYQTMKARNDGFRVSYVVPWDTVPDSSGQTWTQYYFYAPCKGVHPKEYDPDSALYNDYSQYESAPFYFVNGGLIGDYTTHSFDGKIQRYPKESYRSLEYGFFGPGRDLFEENRYGNVIDGYHSMGYGITTWKPMIGSAIRTRQTSKYYNADLYMTINGASAWCGNDITEDGFFDD